MQTQWKAWLAQLAADGMDAVLPSIVRGEVYSLDIPLPGDLSGEMFAFTVRLAPDATVLETATVTVGSYDSDAEETTVTVDFNGTQVGTIGTAAGDADFDGVAEVVFQLEMNSKRLSAGIIPISGEA